jgi:cobalt/nickel transport system permease protein
MHIPDGYLSPSTCAVLYAGAAPFWYVALRKVRRTLHGRGIPLLSLFSAASFVIMMFNVPLPGGTTGHAVGMTLAAIVLGPWGAVLAISIALLIQAVFFGDGGITAFGANCFNMAVVGAWVAWFVYRLAAAGAPVDSRRRVAAAAVAGYVAINAAAACAAVEFGLQPALFRDAAGAPLYAPYPLKIALPAMLAGHLTFAGLAEAILGAGAVAWLQRAEPSLLRVGEGSGAAGAVRTRPLWLALAGLMIATPLGLLAAGAAWGEWGVEELHDPASRAAIAAASGGVAPPAEVPHGLARLASLWTAPIPDYAPAFLKSEVYGYVMSAVLGTGLILLACLLLGRLPGPRPKARRDRRAARVEPSP